MQSICFVMPAWQRYELTEICHRLRRACQKDLKLRGLDAQTVVIADDENLDLAQQYGFATIERDNEWLGRRYNDGIEWAAKNGFDFVLPMCTDMVIRPDAFWYPHPHAITTSPWMSIVAPTGRERVDCLIHYKSNLSSAGEMGATAVIPTEFYAHCRYRPAVDEIKRNCLFSQWNSLRADMPKVWREPLPLEVIDFHSLEAQISSYDRIRQMWGDKVTVNDPFVGMDGVFPAAFIADIRSYYLNQPRKIERGPTTMSSKTTLSEAQLASLK